MLMTVEGVYRNGHVELNETPPEVVDGQRVIVIFLEAQPSNREVGQMITYGKYQGPIDTTEEDFKSAEFRVSSDY